MNFKRERYTNKKEGVHVRRLGIDVVNLTKDVESEAMGMVVFSDKHNTIYMCMEKEQFNKEFVEGWLSKEELGLEAEEKESLGDKVGEVIDNIQEDVNEVVDNVQENIEDIADKVEDTIDEVVENIEDVKEAVTDIVDDIKDVAEKITGKDKKSKSKSKAKRKDK